MVGVAAADLEDFAAARVDFVEPDFFVPVVAFLALVLPELFLAVPDVESAEVVAADEPDFPVVDFFLVEVAVDPVVFRLVVELLAELVDFLARVDDVLAVDALRDVDLADVDFFAAIDFFAVEVPVAAAPPVGPDVAFDPPDRAFPDAALRFDPRLRVVFAPSSSAVCVVLDVERVVTGFLSKADRPAMGTQQPRGVKSRCPLWHSPGLRPNRRRTTSPPTAPAHGPP